MKTKEFIEEVERLGFGIMREHHEIEIWVGEVRSQTHGSRVGTVKTKKENVVQISGKFEGLTLKSSRGDLLKSIFDYASTPLEEREEEKKYIYEFPLPVKGSRHYRLKHIVRNQDELWLDGSEKHHVLQMSAFHFTDAEVESYPEDIQALFKACNKELVE